MIEETVYIERLNKVIFDELRRLNILIISAEYESSGIFESGYEVVICGRAFEIGQFIQSNPTVHTM